MRDILAGVAVEANRLGVDASVVDDEFDDDPEAVHVIIPHEYFAGVPQERWPTSDALSRTIALTVEHPGTPWFDTSSLQAQRCAAIFDINADARAELRRRGLRAESFQIGYTEAWDCWHGRDTARDVDLLYMGSADSRRDAMLAANGRWWSDRAATIFGPPLDPRSTDTQNSVTGSAKYDLLTRSKVLINAHRLESHCFEWVRAIEAMCNGCVLVSEHSSDSAPLVPGDHYVSVSLESLGIASRALVDDDPGLQRLRMNAYKFLREQLTMRPSVERLLSLALELLKRRHPIVVSVAPPDPVPPPPPPAWPGHPNHLDVIGAAVRQVTMKLRSLERSIQLLSLPEGLDGDFAGITTTSSFEMVSPRVSVITSLYNKEDEVVDALQSVVESRDVAYELLIGDDASTDHSLERVAQFLHERPWFPAALIHSRFNVGPSAVRNELARRARADLVFVLDADNGVYPTSLRRLADALDDDPTAAFAYAPIAGRRGTSYTKLVSAFPWEPSRFRQGNYIDGMAMIRRDVLMRLGGWSSEVDGWEDFHLWVRMAEAHMHATFVPQVLSWYRFSEHSLTLDIAGDHIRLWSRLRAAAPTILHD
jgi:hypothetical protein